MTRDKIIAVSRETIVQQTGFDPAEAASRYIGVPVEHILDRSLDTAGVSDARCLIVGALWAIKLMTAWEVGVILNAPDNKSRSAHWAYTKKYRKRHCKLMDSSPAYKALFDGFLAFIGGRGSPDEAGAVAVAVGMGPSAVVLWMESKGPTVHTACFGKISLSVHTAGDCLQVKDADDLSDYYIPLSRFQSPADLDVLVRFLGGDCD